MEKIKSLSFSGGALKGISFCGVLKYLETKNILPGLEQVSGTSIGALFGLMITTGYTSLEIESIIMKLDFYRFNDIDLSTFFEKYGIATGAKIENFIGAILKKKGYSKDITFEELQKVTGIELSILCCKLNDCSQVVFNHKNTPHFKISTACKISMSIPILWKSNKIEEDYLIDGVFSRNLPIHLHDPKTALGFYLLSPNKTVVISSLADYIFQINSCVFKKSQDLEIENCISKGYRIIQLTSSTGAMNLDMTNEQKAEIIGRAYDECLSFFLKGH